MNTNGILRKHWFRISSHFLLDAVLFFVSSLVAIWLRFGSQFDLVVAAYWPFIVSAAGVLSALLYIFGLYSIHSVSEGPAKRALVLAFCVAPAAIACVAAPYLNLFHPLGRGAVLLIGGIAYISILLHHLILLHGLLHTRERVAYIVSCRFDEMETRLFGSFGTNRLELAGVIENDGYAAHACGARVLGKASDMARIVKREKISRVLCTNRSLRDQTLLKPFCELRYSGVTVMPLISLCEEVDQYVPLELLSSEWLLNASGEPQLLYIKKVKRLFDITVSIMGLILASPFLLAGMLAVKLTSPGPIFYQQARSGRFGRIFRITKLRTMCVDAEKTGAVWAGKNDSRVTPVGRLLRKYRIDEIPQFVHVLMGDMSFVGPRPERPEIIEKLAKEVPYYQERLMVQPGITGWAQVNYPYGASAEDARRKLEYDLYYMKHMSVFLDMFILLDTVRIVLRGGAASPAQYRAERAKAMSDYSRLSGAEEQRVDAMAVPLTTV